MKMRALERCKWDDIQIGEVFAYEGCWEIYYKIEEDNVLYLTGDWEEDFFWSGMAFPISMAYNHVYKLPMKYRRETLFYCDFSPQF